MSKVTRNDLSAKTRKQLAALFAQVVTQTIALRAASPERDAALSLLAMISAEQARRGPTP